jgi:hypothetical protein
MAEYKPYTQVMAELAKQTPPPVPAQIVRHQPVEIPGVLNQTRNLFQPVNIEQLNRGRDK